MSELPTPLRLVIIDDNPQDRALAARELRRAFPEVEIQVVATAEECRQVIEADHFDAVITDYQLNWTTGLKVLEVVKRRYPTCPVVMFTGSGTQEIAVEAMKSGLDDYVVKSPHHYVRLPVAVRFALERQERERAIAAAEVERTQLLQELRARVDELAVRDRRKDEFLAVLGHELRNPLGALSNSLHLIEQLGELGPRSRSAFTIARRQVTQLQRLVDDLLSAARITRGHFELEFQRLDLRQPLRQAADVVRPAMNLKHQELEVIFPEEPVPVEGDLARLEQVFTNLLDNACKYTPPAGAIQVSLHAEGRAAVACFIDTGIGIAPEDQDRVFDLFSQVGRSTTQHVGGLGVGLHLVRFLVERHGGSISLTSAGPGQGSTFMVQLPLVGPSLP